MYCQPFSFDLPCHMSLIIREGGSAHLGAAEMQQEAIIKRSAKRLGKIDVEGAVAGVVGRWDGEL